MTMTLVVALDNHAGLFDIKFCRKKYKFQRYVLPTQWFCYACLCILQN